MAMDFTMDTSSQAYPMVTATVVMVEQEEADLVVMGAALVAITAMEEG